MSYAVVWTKHVWKTSLQGSSVCTLRPAQRSQGCGRGGISQ